MFAHAKSEGSKCSKQYVFYCTHCFYWASKASPPSHSVSTIVLSIPHNLNPHARQFRKDIQHFSCGFSPASTLLTIAQGSTFLYYLLKKGIEASVGSADFLYTMQQPAAVLIFLSQQLSKVRRLSGIRILHVCMYVKILAHSACP